MTDRRGTRWLEILFIALAVAGLAGSWAQIPAYLSAGFWSAQVLFWKDTLVTPASVFLVVDITVLAAAVTIWLFAECRRLGIKPPWAWGYFLGSLLIAISCFVPLFFAHRQRRLRLSHPDQAAVPAGSDFVAVVLVLLGVVNAVAYSFTHVPG